MAKAKASQSPAPFLKWVGGKRQLLAEIERLAPKRYDKYFEPFLGGGSVLFNFAPHSPVINDINPHLTNAYLQIKNNPQNLLSEINRIDSVPCNKEYYYSTRNRYNEKISNNQLDEECAALMIWLNKHCFNGVYRVNSKGLFNVPYNNSTNIQTVVPENIQAVSNYLNSSGATILTGDFEDACQDVSEGDFVYFDSPYIPESKTANFVDYTKDGFSYENHVRLANLFKKLDEKGAKLMLSNNNVELVYDLYKGFNITPITARRSVNRNSNGRLGKEVIITNYSQDETQAA